MTGASGASGAALPPEAEAAFRGSAELGPADYDFGASFVRRSGEAVPRAARGGGPWEALFLGSGLDPQAHKKEEAP